MKRPALGNPNARALLGLALLLPALASAQTTSNIDPNQAFVWSETVGWIHFLPTHGGVAVFDTHLEGFAWSENIGWIKMGATSSGPYANTNATDWGVNRAADGTLSGFAWSETAGWINFGSTHGQLAIDPTSKRFNGFAWARNFGFVHFSSPTGLYRLGLLLSLLEIPTLGEWGLILLTLLLGAASLRRMRKLRETAMGND
jgi:hypothetical protein